MTPGWSTFIFDFFQDYKTYTIGNIDDVINFQLDIFSIEHMRENLYTVYIEFHFLRQVLTPA